MVSLITDPFSVRIMTCTVCRAPEMVWVLFDMLYNIVMNSLHLFLFSREVQKWTLEQYYYTAV